MVVVFVIADVIAAVAVEVVAVEARVLSLLLI